MIEQKVRGVAMQNYHDVMQNPELYDAEMEDATWDLAYWQELVARDQPKHVLELACGTGRITLPVAEKARAVRDDARIVGLDLSSPALSAATRKQRELDPTVAGSVTFSEADMRSFELQERFDLIFIGLNSFAHLHETDDQLACLRTVRRHLAPEGRFAIDIPTPYCLWQRSDLLDTPPLRLMRDQPVPALGIARFLQYAAHSYEPLSQTYRLHYINEIDYTDGRHERAIHGARLHIYFPAELRMLLNLAGFTPVEQYGTYLREPFHPRSWQYLWVMAPLDAMPGESAG